MSIGKVSVTLAWGVLECLLLCPAAQSTLVTVYPSARGWIQSDGSTNLPWAATDNYIVGRTAEGPDANEYRNLFIFDPVFAGTVVSATLIVDVGYVGSPDASETYQVTSLPASFGFADLGTGVYYGEKTFDPGDAGDTFVIPLSPAAVAAIVSGSEFRIGGRMTTISSETYEYVFGLTDEGGASILKIVAIPEPSTHVLLGAGLLALGAWRRRRRGRA